jgi:hypothetical protein
MSRRKRRPGAHGPAGTGAGEAQRSAAGAPSSELRPARRSELRSSRRLALDLGILAAIFAVTVGIAELAGAADLGVAFGIGQVAFAIALVALLLRA